MNSNYQEIGTWRQATAALLIADKVNFKPKLVARSEDWQNLLIKRTLYQDDMTIANIFASNIRDLNFTKQTSTRLKIQIDHFIMLGDLITISQL